MLRMYKIGWILACISFVFGYLVEEMEMDDGFEFEVKILM